MQTNLFHKTTFFFALGFAISTTSLFSFFSKSKNESKMRMKHSVWKGTYDLENPNESNNNIEQFTQQDPRHKEDPMDEIHQHIDIVYDDTISEPEERVRRLLTEIENTKIHRFTNEFVGARKLEKTYRRVRLKENAPLLRYVSGLLWLCFMLDCGTLVHRWRGTVNVALYIVLCSIVCFQLALFVFRNRLPSKTKKSKTKQKIQFIINKQVIQQQTCPWYHSHY